MFKEFVNSLQFDLIINTIDPLLIKSGLPDIHGVDAIPIMTRYTGEDKALPLIPGSSLKGVFRSHLEKIINTVGKGEQTLVCLPYEQLKQDNNKMHWEKRSPQSKAWQVFCGNKLEYLQNKHLFGYKKIPPDSEKVYRYSCPVCRLFGSTFFKGRMAVSDAYLTEKGRNSYIIQRRDGIAIDRFTGATAKSALFQSEVVSNAEFKTSVNIRNFEIWQLGMVGLLLKDLEEQRIRIGSGTSRGLGLIQAAIENFTISFIRTIPNPENEIWGIGRYFKETNAQKVKSYGLFENDFLTLEHNTLPAVVAAGIYKKQVFTAGEALNNLFKISIQDFIDKINSWKPEPDMRMERPELAEF